MQFIFPFATQLHSVSTAACDRCIAMPPCYSCTNGRGKVGRCFLGSIILEVLLPPRPISQRLLDTNLIGHDAGNLKR